MGQGRSWAGAFKKENIATFCCVIQSICFRNIYKIKYDKLFNVFVYFSDPLQNLVYFFLALYLSRAVAFKCMLYFLTYVI